MFKNSALQYTNILISVGLIFAALSIASIDVRAQDSEPSGDVEKAIALFNEGQTTHEKGDLTAAVRLYNSAIELVPDFPEAHYQKAVALVGQRNPEEAEKAFRKAVELRPDWSLALAGLGALLVNQKKYELAEPFLLKATELDSQNYPAFAALAELRLGTNASNAMLSTLLSKIDAVSRNPRSPASIWSARGSLEKKLAKFSEAKSSLKKALVLEPTNRTALFDLADLYLIEGDSTAADSAITQLERSYKAEDQTKVLRARHLIAIEKKDEALALLKTVEGTDQNAAEIIKFLTTSENETISDLESLLEKNPTDARVLTKLCIRLRTADAVRALEMCRRSFESDPSNLTPAIGYGAALVQAKQFVEAENLLKRLREISPENSTIRANLATALFQQKRYSDAKIEYQWITEKQPNSSIAFYLLAITHDQLGELADAMANYQQFLRIADPRINQLEIDKVKLRLPILDRQLKEKKSKRN